MTTLNDLREDLKRVFAEYSTYRASMNPPNGSRNKSMREHYNFCKKVIVKSPNITARYRDIATRLVRAGDIYYHAKKHGLQSAMLLKLSNDY